MLRAHRAREGLRERSILSPVVVDTVLSARRMVGSRYRREAGCADRH
jgi:hypothetical protein